MADGTGLGDDGGSGCLGRRSQGLIEEISPDNVSPRACFLYMAIGSENEHGFNPVYYCFADGGNQVAGGKRNVTGTLRRHADFCTAVHHDHFGSRLGGRPGSGAARGTAADDEDVAVDGT